MTLEQRVEALEALIKELSHTVRLIVEMMNGEAVAMPIDARTWAAVYGATHTEKEEK